MQAEWIIGLISAALGTGTGSLLTTLLQGRAVARKVDAEAAAINVKTPAEADSIAIQGAEAAVRMLQQSNGTLAQENERLFRENARLRSQLEQMEERLEQMRKRAEVAEQALATASAQLRLVRDDYEKISAQIETFRSQEGRAR